MTTSGSPQKQDVFVTVVAPIPGGRPDITWFVTQTAHLLREHYANYELVLVDDGADEAVIRRLTALLKDIACVRVIRLSQATNHDVKVFAGLESAIGDYVVVLTPGVDPPRVVTELVALLREGRDIVYGVSLAPVHHSPVVRLGSWLFRRYCGRYLGLSIPPNSTYLVALNRRSINALTRIKGRYRHIRHLGRQVGFNAGLYHYAPEPSAAAPEELGVLASARLAKEIVVSYSGHPLRAASMLGMLAGSANLVYAGCGVVVGSVDGGVGAGWTALSFPLAVMFFLLFVVLAVVCEYLGRVLEEIRARPAYHIMEELHSTVLVADESRRNVTM